MVLTAAPTVTPSTPGTTAATVPAASYPRRAGSLGSSRYWPLRNIDSARFSPSALTAIWTSPLPGGGTSSSSIWRTSGPPVLWNRTTRAMSVSSQRATGILLPKGPVSPKRPILPGSQGDTVAGRGPYTSFRPDRSRRAPRPGAPDDNCCPYCGGSPLPHAVRCLASRTPEGELNVSRIVVQAFVTLDGVVQAGGGPDE